MKFEFYYEKMVFFENMIITSEIKLIKKIKNLIKLYF